MVRYWGFILRRWSLPDYPLLHYWARFDLDRLLSRSLRMFLFSFPLSGSFRSLIGVAFLTNLPVFLYWTRFDLGRVAFLTIVLVIFFSFTGLAPISDRCRGLFVFLGSCCWARFDLLSLSRSLGFPFCYFFFAIGPVLIS